MAAAATERGAVVLPVGGAAPLPELPPNSIFVMPAEGSAGKLTTDSDLFLAKDVLGDYLPVRESQGDGLQPSSGSDVYRIARGDEVVVYTRTADSTKDRDVFTVHRLRSEDLDYGAPLSERRLEGEALPKDDRMLFMRPSADLEAAITKLKLSKLAEWDQLSPEELLKFRPEGASHGHKLDAELGDVAHVAFGNYADASKDLQRGWNQGGKIPDGADSSGGLIDLKTETPTGIKAGIEDIKYYGEQLKRETSILLHSNLSVLEQRNALNKKIAAAWDAYDPNWRLHWTKEGRKQAEELRKMGINVPPVKARPKPESKVQKVNKKRKRQS